jgi:shikimate dehydrogenase
MRELPGRLVLIGHPVSHSRSPAFQNAALRSAGLPLEYEALDVPHDALTATVRGLVAERAAGNVTVPHKESVAALCDNLSPLASRVGAVNTFWTEDGVLAGDNTDVAGFTALAHHLLGSAPGELRVAIIGAGGAAAAAVAAVASWKGSRVQVVSRSPERAARLAGRFGDHAVAMKTVTEALDGAQLVVNATPLGVSSGGPLPVDMQELNPAAYLLDLNYAPGATHLVREARNRGLRAMDGARMLLEQGVESYRRWFDSEPDVGAMAFALEQEGLDLGVPA